MIADTNVAGLSLVEYALSMSLGMVGGLILLKTLYGVISLSK